MLIRRDSSVSGFSQQKRSGQHPDCSEEGRNAAGERRAFLGRLRSAFLALDWSRVVILQMTGGLAVWAFFP